MMSVLVVSLIALIGIFSFAMKLDKLKKMVLFLVSFSAGALLGDAFIHLIPETIEQRGFGATASLVVLFGIFFSFIVEKAIQWRHCHLPTTGVHPHPFAYMNLFGDGVHNFIDGLIIAASYLASIPVGIATTVAVLLHEIPQELGDFGILIHGGFTKNRAILMNFLTALTSVAGAVIALLLSAYVQGAVMYLLPFAAGGFIYIAASDLIPELHKTCDAKVSYGQVIAMVLGMAVMYLFIFLE